MMNRRLLPILLALIFFIGVGILVFCAPIYNDDPYITFRYAWNFAHGNGLVYNVGEYVAGSTTPLYSLVLGVMMWCGLPLRGGVGVLAVLAYGLIGVSSWRIFRRNGFPWGGVVLPLLLLGNPTLISLYGNETSLAMGLALAAFALHAEGRVNAALIVAAVLVGVRPDGALVGIVLALVTLEKDKRKLWPALAWGALVLVPFYIAFVIYYHALVPHTLAVKTAQGAASDVAPFWKGTLQFVENLFSHQLPTGILVAIGFVLMMRRSWTSLPLFVLLYTLAFCLINPPYYYWWYQYPYWLMRDATVAWAIGWIAVLPMWQRRQRIAWMRHLAAAILLIGVCFATLWPDRAKVNQYRARYLCYEKTADFIKSGGPSAIKKIICEEIGIIGYELPDWRIYDMAGLVHLRPYHELIEDSPPLLAVVRGDQKKLIVPTATGRPAGYQQILIEQENDFACSLMGLD